MAETRTKKTPAKKKAAKTVKEKKMGRPPKFDYASDEFYEEVLALAMQGMTDAEIAYNLSDRFGESLHPDIFARMVKGKYDGWTKQQNKEYGERLCRVLARGRTKINAIVRATYLKAALGQTKAKGVSTTKRHLVIDGEQTEDEVVQTTETENTGVPNMQALATWLYHHDAQWRRVQRGVDVEDSDLPQNIKHGVGIDAWIKKETESDDD